MLVTGARGFIGSHLLTRLRNCGWQTVTLARDQLSGERLDLERDSEAEQWARGLRGIDAVVHLAAIAHRKASASELAETNHRWPVTVYSAASVAGVASFVWLSSIKVLGDISTRPLRTRDDYRPGDDYAASKMRGELDLLAAAANGATTLTILRTPLVYGPGVKANFAALLKLADLCRRGLPVPLGGAKARRSLIGVRNLCDLIVSSMGHAGVFHGADDQDVSVVELLEVLGADPSLLLSVPPHLMRFAAEISGQRARYDRLFESLQLDQRDTARQLGWRGPFSMAEQAADACALLDHLGE